MPITISDRTKIRPTIDYKHIPAVAAVAMTNPGPCAVQTTGTTSSGNALVGPASGDAGRGGYAGYNVMSNVAAGDAPSLMRGGVIVEGFSGVSPGLPVFVDATSADASGTASGLTHTLPVTGDVRTPIGVGFTASKILFY